MPLVAGSTLLVSLLASATRKGLDRLTNRAPTVWTRLAVTVSLVSLAPLTYVQASSGAKATLALMHLAVAAVLLPILGRRDGDRPGTWRHDRDDPPAVRFEAPPRRTPNSVPAEGLDALPASHHPV
ncbi:DUF6069 family protein [Streptomyces sp. NPDC020801]|uniref:DUF6069 family protein n=1 Tax=Streptomyces sp. NPDC020801 TaxID=3365093 RepID=UPI00379065E9